jgi:hypothetical protein
MGLVISKGLTLARTFDPEITAYIAAVETADGQALEPAVKTAYINFILGCKADGIWNAIKASCILAGARTRLGALTPLAGTAPTSFNFVDGDYNRKTGLVGDGSTKYLDSNRNNNADPQNSQHVSVFATTALVGGWIGGGTFESGTTALLPLTTFRARSRSATLHTSSIDLGTGLSGINRPLSTQFILRGAGANETVSITSQSPLNVSIRVFARGGLSAPPAEDYTASRLAFYSIGESLDLALLDARVTDLINAFAAAIP